MNNSIIMRKLLTYLLLFTSFNLFAQVPNYVPTDSLVGYWPFNGNAIDESGNLNDGTVNGATLTTDRFGTANAAYDFDGVDDFINISAVTQINNQSNYTWSFWSNFPNNQISGNSGFNATGAFLKCGSWWLTLGHSGTPGLFYKDEQGSQGNTWYKQLFFNQFPSINDWHHFVITKENSLITVFLDGQNVGSLTSSGFVNFNSNVSVWLGRKDSGQGSSYYSGMQDDFGLWNRALNPTEISTLYYSSVIVNGCTDTLACNFDLSATDDDSSCVYPSSSSTIITTCDSVVWNGTTYDSSGTYSTNVTSDNNYSMSFDGNDYVSINNTGIDLSNNFSFSIGFNNQNLNSTHAWQVLFSDLLYDLNQGIGIYRSYTELKYTIGNTYNEKIIATVPNNTFFVLTCTYSNNNINFYIGDSLVHSNSVVINSTSLNELVLGSRFDNDGLTIQSNNYFTGLLDNLSIWNTALSQTEIQQYMNCPPTGNEEGLVGYWDFDEGEGITVFDQTANGNNGTINGATYNTNVPYQTCPLINENGCDSTSILNLTINQSDTSYTNITACDSVIWNGTTYDSSGTYSYNGGVSNNYSMNILSNEWIDIPSWTPTPSYTLSARVEFPLPNDFALQWNTIFQKSLGDYHHILFDPNGELGLYSNSFYGCGLYAYSLSPGFHHITSIAENNETKFYIDGNYVGVSNIKITEPIGIIGNHGGADQPVGIIDDVHIWSTTLTHSEILQYMNCPPSGNEDGLVGYWNFEEGEGTTVFDQTANGNNGTINGATYNTNVPYQTCPLINENGCDSSAILNLTINNSVFVIDSVTICDGVSVSVGENIYDTTGSYIDTLQTANGCDSIINTVVDLMDVNISQNDTAICLGDSVVLAVNGNSAGWQLYYLEDFENTISSEWNTTSSLNYNSTTVLGNFGNTTVNLYLANLPSYDSLRIDFDLYLIDSWDGNQTGINGPDIWDLSINQSSVLNTTFSGGSTQSYPGNYLSSYPYQTGATLTNLPGLCWNGSSTRMYQISNSVISSNNILEVDFSANGLQSLCDESWALDNVKVYLYSNNSETNTVWSTGETTASITVRPDSTTPFWVTQTQNGVSCTDSVTITVNQVDTSYTNITTCNSYDWNGTTYDSSGTYSTNVTSDNNYSISFDGEDDWVGFGDNSSFDFGNTDFTISLWVNREELNSVGNFMIGKWNTGALPGTNEWLLYNENETGEDALRFTFESGTTLHTVESVYPVGLFQWNYITAQRSGDSLFLFVSGELVSSVFIGQASINNVNRELYLSRLYAEGSTSTTVFTKCISDNIQIWNTALSEQEIQQYMNCPPAGNEGGLVGYWDFEEGDGTIVFDQTANGNNGTINGASYNNDVPYQSCALTNVNGCYSTAVLNLTINNSVFVVDSVTICDGGSISVGGSIYDEIGNYIDTLQTANGCDSIINTVVDIMDVNISINDTTICLGDSIIISVSVDAQNINSQQACSLSELPTDLQNGLVAYYPFFGNSNDESGNGNHGTVNGAILTTDRFGNDNAAYNFDGIDDHIYIQNDQTLNNGSVTIAGWCKISNSPVNEYSLISKWYQVQNCDSNSDTYVTLITSENKLLSGTSLNFNISFISIQDILLNTWTFFTMTYNQNNGGDLYINGQLVYTDNITGAICNSTNPVYLGAGSNNGNLWRFLNGNLDDVYLYDRALSFQEIQELYNSSSIPSSDIYWSTNDTTANIIVAPSQTTTYWVTHTQNGVSCTDSVTITVNPVGCTDNTSFNYDANTICDNGSCYPFIYGCTSEWADNYITLIGDVNVDVNTADESCYRYGCTYDWAVSFDSLATIDDGSCLLPVNGCTDTTALNFNPNANTEDGSCILVVEGCTDEIAFNYNNLANTEDGSCEYICTVPSSWNFELSDINHTLMIPEDISIQVNGAEIALGSTIGVFYTNDSGELQCAGYTSLTGEVTFIAVMGDDSTTDEIDGLQEGNELVWMAWDINTCAQYVLSATYSSGSTIFTPYDLTFLESLNHYTCQSITLPGGWYMYSSYIQAEDMDAEVVLSSLAENLLILKDNDGNAYLPEWDFNGIGELDFRQGYQVKTNTLDTLELCGLQKYPEANPLFISQGWNLISYLRESPSPVDVVLEDMSSTGNLLLIKDFNGNPYLPEWNFNGIGDMLPGQGYQLKALELDTLFYLSNDLDYRVSTSRVINSKLKHFDRPLNTGNNMQIVIPENVWGSTVEEGSEISAYNAVGKLVGATVYSNPTTVLTLWGNDVNTELVDGLLVNEPVALKVWNNERLRDFEITNWSIGANSYEIDAVNVVSSIDFSPDYALTSLFDAIPNPSYQTTNISFFIIESTKVNISVYTILGELMEVIANSKYTEGLHEIEMNVSHLEAGSYFYTMTTADFKQTNQLIILKE